METLKKAVVRIAYTKSFEISTLPSLERWILVPILSLASHSYSFALTARSRLYAWGILKSTRLPVPVISVGNITWGGNGKTPMTEYIASFFANHGISPLVLTSGYAGGDETRMLQNHLSKTTAKVGAGPHRKAVAYDFLQRHKVMDCQKIIELTKVASQNRNSDVFVDRSDNGIGVIILDDGMQHLSISRDVEIIMINCLTVWGNGFLIPRGPMREPLNALRRADIVIFHHVNLISEARLASLVSILQKILDKSIPVFGSKMVPCYFSRLQCIHSTLPLETVQNRVVLCVSGIGCPESVSSTIEKMGASHVDRLDFIDHHNFCKKDLQNIQAKVQELESRFGKDIIIVVTEKDFERDREAFSRLDNEDILVLHSLVTMENCFTNPNDTVEDILLDRIISSLCRNVEQTNET